MPSLGPERLAKTVFTIILVAALYAISGFLGSFFATPPGYATAIWAPSGIALGAVLIWGLWMLPGVFIGSLITNFFITAAISSDTTLTISLLIGLMIATGATLQAFMGWVLIRRWVGLHNLLNEPNDIILFAFLSGPISCLVNTTWSNTGLVLLNVQSINSFAYSWLTWWIGDIMGVLIFTPVFLILFAHPRMIWRDRIITILAPLALSFFAIVSTFIFVQQAELKRLHTIFEQTMANNISLMEQKIAADNIPSKDLDLNLVKDSFRDNNGFYKVNIFNLSKANYVSDSYLHKFRTKAGNVTSLQFEKRVTIAGKDYVLVVEPTAKFINKSFSRQTWFVLLSGLLFCALINVVLFIIHGQKSLAQVGMAEKSYALRRVKNENLLILRAAGEGIYGIDSQGCISFINPAAAKMLGYEEDELIGKPIHELIHHSYPDGSLYVRDKCFEYLAFLYNKTYHVTDELFWRKDGSSFWVEYTATPLIADHYTNGAVVVFTDITHRKETELELERLALIDPLTSLPNRISFMQKIMELTSEAKDKKESIAVCIIDIDNFKQINDSLTHKIGDETLKVIITVIKPLLPKDAYMARIGGDEFGLIFQQIKTERDIGPLLDNIVERLKNPLSINNLEVSLSISMGLAILGLGGSEGEDLIRNAEIAMYYAKESGHGTYEFYDEEIHRIIKRQLQIDAQLRQAVARKEFSLEYQRQVNAKGELVGVEALLRWHNPELAEVMPSEFIPIAERSGVIYNIGEWVLSKACHDYRRIREIFKVPLLLSINVSVMQLENTQFRRSLEMILKQSEMSGDNLLLEITETALMHNQDYILRVMNDIKKLGIRFALDDFGISYSSLQYLKKLPVSFIKIDKGFIKDLATIKSDEKIVNASIQLSKALGIHSIAEGVENLEQFNILIAMGCEYMQGYYFAKPVSINELLRSLTIVRTPNPQV